MRRILGNVGAFQLPNGKYAFGRIFKDSTVAFYKHFGEKGNDLAPDEKYAFLLVFIRNNKIIFRITFQPMIGTRWLFGDLIYF